MAKRSAGEVASDFLSIMGMGESQQPEPIEPDTSTAPEPIAETPVAPTASTAKQPRSKRKSYQIWVPEDEYATWKAYQQASAELPKREDLGFKAIREYIDRHPLADNELAIYNAILKRDGITE